MKRKNGPLVRLIRCLVEILARWIRSDQNRSLRPRTGEIDPTVLLQALRKGKGKP